MAQGARAAQGVRAAGGVRAAQWWAVAPAGQVSHLVGADPELLRIGLDPLPAGAPAVVQFCPDPQRALGEQAALVLAELDRLAVALFPRWLPGAERFDGGSGLSVPAVRVLADRIAARSRNFGPFLAELAERALRGEGGRSRFSAEVRAAGLARVIADAYGRASTALLIEVPDGLPVAGERALVAAAEWLAHHGRLAVWLVGVPLRVVDRVPEVRVRLPEYLTRLIDSGPGVPAGASAPARPVLTYPPLAGAPRADSTAEQRLERALTPYEWARGRQWNCRYECDPLGQPYRLDLFWPDAGLVVEVDGPEHRQRLKFADDRHRDVQLSLRGLLVVRFTNEEVLADVHAVLRAIERLLCLRRSLPALDLARDGGLHVDDSVTMDSTTSR